MKRIISTITAALVLSLTSLAGAATFDFSGTLNYNTDVRFFSFSLASDATNVRVWTDSYQSGTNFDPITALWKSDGTLIAENDDNPNINPATQTSWDSGFTLSSLSAGDYLFSVAAFSNFAKGSTLAEGFQFDGTTPIAIEDWWVEAPGNYHVVLDGVDSASDPSAVPEPGTMMLLGVGMAGLALYGRSRKNKQA